jgi:hypothetical protein
MDVRTHDMNCGSSGALPRTWAWRVARLGLSGMVLFLLTMGCAGYRLGPTNPEITAGKTVQVQFFENRTLEPRLSEALNHALRKQLQQDGSYKLTSQQGGNVVVRGAIIGYERLPLAYQRRDVVTATDFEIRMVARLTAIERATGRILVDRDVSGRTSVRAGPDLNSAERQALPLLAADWARNATTLLTEGSW